MPKSKNFWIFLIVLAIALFGLLFFIIFYEYFNWPDGKITLMGTTLTTCVSALVILYVQILSEEYQEKGLKNQIRRERLKENTNIYIPIFNETKTLLDLLRELRPFWRFESFEIIHEQTEWLLIDEKFKKHWKYLKNNLILYEEYRKKVYTDIKSLILDEFKEANVENVTPLLKNQDLDICIVILSADISKDIEKFWPSQLKDKEKSNIEFMGKKFITTKEEFVSGISQCSDKIKKSPSYTELKNCQKNLLEQTETLKADLSQAIKEPWLLE